jgi:acyl carrier protein
MKDKLRTIIADILEVEPELIKEGSSADTMEGWDSFKQMNMIVAIEEEFGIEFDEEESILANSYDDLLRLISSKSQT